MTCGGPTSSPVCKASSCSSCPLTGSSSRPSRPGALSVTCRKSRRLRVSARLCQALTRLLVLCAALNSCRRRIMIMTAQVLFCILLWIGANEARDSNFQNQSASLIEWLVFMFAGSHLAVQVRARRLTPRPRRCGRTPFTKPSRTARGVASQVSELWSELMRPRNSIVEVRQLARGVDRHHCRCLCCTQLTACIARRDHGE